MESFQERYARMEKEREEQLQQQKLEQQLKLKKMTKLISSGIIGLLLLIVWGGLSLYNYVRTEDGGIIDKEELKEAQKMYDEQPKPKRKSSKKSEFPIEPHSKTVKSSKSKTK